ncbi:MAG TPA: type II secretion system protein [Terriglobales bacterium]|nr:type II secretion system protein [Terriglobales bacterium]
MKCSRHLVRSRRESGFTLIELMIVVSIILILVSTAIPIYQQSIIRAREAVLRQNLFTLRSVIDQYSEDKQKAPQSLEDIVAAGYLKQIPVDPITGSRDTWQVVQEDVLLSVDQNAPGITDIHSGAQGNGSDGVPYSEW